MDVDEHQGETTAPEGEVKQKRIRPKKKKKNLQQPFAKGNNENNENKEEAEETKSKLDPEQEARTIFVGNLSTSSNRRDILKHFSKYGKVETVRIRNVAQADPLQSKKVAAIKKNFHEKRSTFSAYVRFVKEESVTAALEANNEIYNGFHLRVDRALGGKKVDSDCALFIGNVPFEAEEDDLRDLFMDCGDIDSVRIIHDKQIGSGKGFAYVNFKNRDGVEIALQKSEIKLKDRQLRVMRYLSKEQVTRRNKKIFRRSMPGNRKMKMNFTNKRKGQEGGKTHTSDFKGDNFHGKRRMNPKKKDKLDKGVRKKMAIAQMLTGNKTFVKRNPQAHS